MRVNSSRHCMQGQAYATMATKILVDEIHANGRSHVLDLGCLCDTNIHFFSGLGCRVYVDDILQLNVRIPRAQAGSSGDSVEALLDQLDYPQDFFDVILCWSVFDHLDAEGCRGLSEQLRPLLKTSGSVLALFRPEAPASAGPVFRYRIMSHAEIVYETLPFPPLTGKPYQSRDLAGLVSPLTLGASYRLKNGWREVVLRK